MASHIYSGRSNRRQDGNLRNFKAMNDGKLGNLFNALFRENNDKEAYEAVELNLILRGYDIARENPFLD